MTTNHINPKSSILSIMSNITQKGKAKKLTMKTILLCNKGSASFARALARRMPAPCKELFVSRFPDGELKLRVPAEAKGSHAILVYSMQPNPNESLLEIMFAIAACRQLGAKKVTLVTPYLGFMRQDKMFHSGEAVSNRIVAKLLSSADRVITIDPHLHRIRSLRQIFRLVLTKNQPSGCQQLQK